MIWSHPCHMQMCLHLQGNDLHGRSRRCEWRLFPGDQGDLQLHALHCDSKLVNISSRILRESQSNHHQTKLGNTLKGNRRLTRNRMLGPRRLLRRLQVLHHEARADTMYEDLDSESASVLLTSTRHLGLDLAGCCSSGAEMYCFSVYMRDRLKYHGVLSPAGVCLENYKYDCIWSTSTSPSTRTIYTT